MLTSTERFRVLSRLFTRPVLSSLAMSEDWQRAFSFLSRQGLLKRSTPLPLRDIFQRAWTEIRQNYRNEYVYKNEIASRLIFGRHSPKTAALHVELPIGRSIVDVAVFNGTSTAYEVKTEYDTTRRLATQTANYSKVFDRVYVVTHPECSLTYAQLVDSTVGVYALTPHGSLSLVKKASSNLGSLDKGTMFRCLQQAEYAEVFEDFLCADVPLPNGLIADRCAEIFEALPLDQANHLFINAMRKRKSGLQVAGFVSSVPYSLRALAYATPLSGRQKLRLTAALEQEVKVTLA